VLEMTDFVIGENCQPDGNQKKPGEEGPWSNPELTNFYSTISKNMRSAKMLSAAGCPAGDATIVSRVFHVKQKN
jgi:hypothetical protein